MSIRRAKTIDADEYRLWSREVFPLLKGMSPRQVMHNRREWIAAVTYLGPRWRMRLREVRKFRPEPILRVIGE